MHRLSLFVPKLITNRELFCQARKPCIDWTISGTLNSEHWVKSSFVQRKQNWLNLTKITYRHNEELVVVAKCIKGVLEQLEALVSFWTNFTKKKLKTGLNNLVTSLHEYYWLTWIFECIEILLFLMKTNSPPIITLTLNTPTLKRVITKTLRHHFKFNNIPKIKLHPRTYKFLWELKHKGVK